MSAKRIALISPSGWGNLGDAAILDTVVDRLQSRLGDVHFVGLTSNFRDTATRHDIEARPSCGFTRPLYSIALESAESRFKAPPLVSDSESPALDASDSPGTRKFGIRRALKQVPYLVSLIRFLRQTVQRLTGFIRSIAGECKHLRQSYLLLKQTDLVIVAGGGQLDDFWGGAWGHPYVLYRWSRLARMTSTEFVVLSVGVGQLSSASSRYFVKRVLELAAYRSYRDQGSKALVKFVRVTESDPVVPDLAFAYQVPGREGERPGGIIGICPMVFKGPIGWPESDEQVFERYVVAMSRLITDLVKSGKQVTLFPSVKNDQRAIDDIVAVLDSATQAAVTCPIVDSVEGLMQTYESVDLTIASRLHGALLSYVAHRPVIALSYERKVDALMQEFGRQQFCYPIIEFSIPDVLKAVATVIENRSEIRRADDVILGRAAEQVDEQFNEIARLLRPTKVTLER